MPQGEPRPHAQAGGVDLSKRRRVLAVVPHPDDECWCSGLLATQVDAGMDVHLAVACNGNLGGMPDKTPPQRARVRRDEMCRAAQVIGCALHWMDIGDSQIMEMLTNDYVELEWRFRDLLREVDPQLLILTDPDDYHHHHRAVSELALNASVNAGNPSLVGQTPPSTTIPATLYVQPLPPAPFTPDIYVDISGTFERKIEALRCHESQHPFLASHHGTDFIGLVTAAAQLHGAVCEVAYAEAYSLCRRFNRVSTIQALAPFFPGAEG